MDSHIINFLRGQCKDYKGRNLCQLRAMGDKTLEKTHDVIQWMFPSDLKSAVYKDAPVLTIEDIATIKIDDKIQSQYALSIDRLVRFYEANDFWITTSNHNFRRITRILRSMWLAGRIHDYCCFQRCLDDIYIDYHDIIGEETYLYWKCANDREFFTNPEKFIKIHKEQLAQKKAKEAEKNALTDPYSKLVKSPNSPYNNDEQGGGYEDDPEDQSQISGETDTKWWLQH